MGAANCVQVRSSTVIRSNLSLSFYVSYAYHAQAIFSELPPKRFVR